MNLEIMQEEIAKEYRALVTQYWDKISQEFAHQHPQSSLAECLNNPNRLPYPLTIGDTIAEHNIGMLSELVSRRPWHAVNIWKKMNGMIPLEKRDFYAEYMIASAKNSNTTLALPYCWLVEQYDHGNFKRYISDTELKEYVNLGFWEYAMYFFDDPVSSGLVCSEEMYECLLQHFELIDFAEFKHLATTLWGTRYWVTDEYETKVREAESQIPIEIIATLVHPIVDQAIQQVFHNYVWFEPEEVQEKLANTLNYWTKYLGQTLIQDLFKYHIRMRLAHIDYWQNNMGKHEVEILDPYVSWNNGEKRRFYSQSLGKVVPATSMIDNHVPTEWFEESTKTRVNEAIIADIRNPASAYQSDVIPFVHMLNDGIRQGWFDVALIRSAVTEKVNLYLKTKRAPAGNKLRWLPLLNPILVDPEIFPLFAERLLKDLHTRRLFKLADEFSTSLTPPA